jgi:hypothetical protein
MTLERAAGGSSLIDVLDRVLDKGIVVDAWVRVSLVGIDLLTVEALHYSDVWETPPGSRPAALASPSSASAPRR